MKYLYYVFCAIPALLLCSYFNDLAHVHEGNFGDRFSSSLFLTINRKLIHLSSTILAFWGVLLIANSNRDNRIIRCLGTMVAALPGIIVAQFESPSN